MKTAVKAAVKRRNNNFYAAVTSPGTLGRPTTVKLLLSGQYELRILGLY